MPRIAVIGLGRFGSRLARSLTAAGAEVLGIDHNRQIIERLRDEITLAVRLDCTDKEALVAQGVDKMSAAVVGIGQNFEAAALVTSLLKDLGVRRIICRAETAIRAQILERIGAHQTVNPEGESAERWAHRLMFPKLEHYVEMGRGHSLVQVEAPAKFVDKSPSELRLRQKYEVNLVAIRRRAEAEDREPDAPVDAGRIIIPAADTKILPGDTLILIGSDEALSDLSKG